MTSEATKAYQREYNKRWRAANKERDREWHRQYYLKNKKRLNAASRKYRKNLYKRQPDLWRHYNLKSKYGLGIADIKHLKKEQNHRCAICRKRKKLNVDHCHKSGRVRGLLCTSCNTALGALGDSPKLVKVALAYLSK